MENQTFSEIYGINKEEIRSQVDTDGIRKLSMEYLEKFPRAVYVLGLKKLKARAMLTAMETGTYEKGNHKIAYEAFLFTFYYRGTPIVIWDAYNDEFKFIHAGEFEGTASTRNQRIEVEKSVENFKESVLRL